MTICAQLSSAVKPSRILPCCDLTVVSGIVLPLRCKMAGERLRNALASYRRRYRKASRAERSRPLDEFCQLTDCHREYATTLLSRRDESNRRRRCRGPTYSRKALEVIEAILRAAGYPRSARLEALIPQWLPWARRHIDGLTPEVEKAAISISPRQSDRRLASKKRRGSRLIGRYREARTQGEEKAPGSSAAAPSPSSA